MERIPKLKGWQRLWLVLTCLALIGAMLPSCNFIYGIADFATAGHSAGDRGGGHDRLHSRLPSGGSCGLDPSPFHQRRSVEVLLDSPGGEGHARWVRSRPAGNGLNASPCSPSPASRFPASQRSAVRSGALSDASARPTTDPRSRCSRCRAMSHALASRLVGNRAVSLPFAGRAIHRVRRGLRGSYSTDQPGRPRRSPRKAGEAIAPILGERRRPPRGGPPPPSGPSQRVQP